MTPQQLEHLLKLIPKDVPNQRGSETDEEIDFGFSGMAKSSIDKMSESEDWIIDSGASDHMTSCLKNLINVKHTPTNFIITLPTGATTLITHVGDVLLRNGMRLKNVLHVPQFNHNLLSIHKLAQDGKCEVTFQPNKCVIFDSTTRSVMGVGEMKQGLYYLRNEKAYTQGVTMNGEKTEIGMRNKDVNLKVNNQFSVWHQRLGHASVSKLRHIDRVKPFLSQQKEQVCLTCPLAKMTNLVFPSSESHASKAFELIHTDIWGPYKVNTRGKFRFFLTLVDDWTIMTWVHLLEKKSDYLSTMIKFEEFIGNQFDGKIQVLR